MKFFDKQYGIRECVEQKIYGIVADIMAGQTKRYDKMLSDGNTSKLKRVLTEKQLQQFRNNLSKQYCRVEINGYDTIGSVISKVKRQMNVNA